MPSHEQLTPLLALRLRNEGFGPNTSMFEAMTLSEVMQSYTTHCRLATEYGSAAGTIDKWLAVMMQVEARFCEGAGCSRGERLRIMANIGLRCSCIMQTPDNPLTYDPMQEAQLLPSMLPAPSAGYEETEGEEL